MIGYDYYTTGAYVIEARQKKKAAKMTKSDSISSDADYLWFCIYTKDESIHSLPYIIN